MTTITHTISQDTVSAYKRLAPYTLDNPAHDGDNRTPPYLLNVAQLTRDIQAAYGDQSLKDVQRYIVDALRLKPVRPRNVFHHAIESGINMGQTRAWHKLKRNAAIRGSLIVGQASYTDITRLAGPNTHRHHAAALVYLLIKQGTLKLNNIDRPEHAHLLYNIKQQAPLLYALLTTDHTAPLNTPEHQLHTIYLTADNIAHNPPLAHQKNPEDSTNATVTSCPDDMILDEAWTSYTPQADFRPIAEPLTVLLQYMASPTMQSLTDDVRLTITLNNDLIPVKRRGAMHKLFVHLYANPTASAYALNTVSLMRVIFCSVIGRPDLWAAWRGDADKRHYHDHNGYATRGSQGRLVGWIIKRLEEVFTIDHNMDLNPWVLYNIAQERVREDRPYKTLKDETFEESLSGVPLFNTQTHHWQKKQNDNKLDDLDADGLDTRY